MLSNLFFITDHKSLHFSGIYHLVSGINCTIHFLSLILLLIHLILHMLDQRFSHHSQLQSLVHSLTLGLNFTCSTNLFHQKLMIPLILPSWTWNRTGFPVINGLRFFRQTVRLFDYVWLSTAQVLRQVTAISGIKQANQRPS